MPRLICLVIVCLLSLVVSVKASEKEEQKPPTIGLTLCGGGAKGFAEIGVLKVLEEIDFPIDYIAGNSIGSIVGAFYAMGYSADTMEVIVRSQNWEELMVDKVERSNQPLLQRRVDSRYSLSVPFSKEGLSFPTGFFEGQNIMRLFSDLSIGYHGNIDFNQLPIPFRCVATDVVEGKEIVLQQGSLVDAIRASMAVPGAFTPVDWEEYLLLDGMMVNNFPVDICRDMGAEYIIGIDIQGEIATKQNIKSLGDIMGNMTSWMSQKKYIQNIEESDFYIRPNIDNFSGADFDKASVDSLIRIGEAAARAVLPQLIEVRDSLGVEKRIRTKRSAPKLTDTFYISSLSLAGSIRTNKNEIFRRFGVTPGATVSLKDIHEGVDRIYGTKYFKYVKYSLIGDENGGYNLILNLSEKKTDRMNVGIHYDSNNDAALLLNTTFSGKSTWGSQLSVDLRLSKNPAFAAQYSMDRGKKPALGANFVISDYNIPYYSDGDEMGNLDLTYYNLSADVHGNLEDNAWVGFRASSEYFNVQKVLNFPIPSVPDDMFYLTYSGFIDFDNQDNFSFPTRGGKVSASYAIHTENGNLFDISQRFTSVDLSAKWALSAGNNFTWLPAIYAKAMWGETFQPYYVSMVGGEEWADYFDQQLPFIGLHTKELFFQNATIFRSDFRFKLWDRHYVTAKMNYGFFANKDLERLFEDEIEYEKYKNIFGGGITYSFDSPIGPMEATFSGSTYRSGVNFFINIGYWF